MKRFVLLNGPPRSGKNTVAEILNKNYRNTSIYKMTSPMDEAFKAFYGINDTEWYKFREKEKDIPHVIFGGNTTRQALIRFSEGFAKTLSGKDIFGKLATYNVEKLKNEIILISDVGFPYEISPLITKYGAKNFLLIKILRDGTDFKKDSRDYISLKEYGVSEIIINNSDTLDFLEKDVIMRAMWFLEETET